MEGGCLKGQSLHNSVVDMDSLDLQHSASILYLPDDMLLYILRFLPAPTLLAFQNVNTRFRHLIRHHPSIWASISFADLWPSPNQFSLFQRASKNGNFEASLKLALAFLYNEGLSLEEESRPEVNGSWATAYLLRAERQATSGTSTPFSWLFIRPPWSPGGGCCKAFVFRCLQSGSQYDGVNSTIVLFCLAKVLGFLDSEVRKYDKAWALEKAAANGLIPAALLSLERQCSARHGDPGRSLHYLRKLRELSASGCWEAQLSLAQALARAYGDGRLSQSDVSAARLSVSHFFQASQPTRADQVFAAQHGMNETMRYILVDWLAEVVTTKELPSSCLHSSVRCLDSCLLQRAVSRSLLQLLGIACLVITSRMLSQDIVTVREGVWLTDNTYKYEDLVRMMGEVVSMLRGKVMMPTVPDYTSILLSLAPCGEHTEALLSYISELSLLFAPLAAMPPARLAASACLLSRTLHRHEPWPSVLADFTGWTQLELASSSLLLYRRCFQDEAPRDHRDVCLTAIRQRFSDSRHSNISEEEVQGYSDVCSALGLKEDFSSFINHNCIQEMQPFLLSPSGSKSKRRREDSERESLLATPVAELSNDVDSREDGWPIKDTKPDTICAQDGSNHEKEDEATKSPRGTSWTTPPWSTGVFSKAFLIPADGANMEANSPDSDELCLDHSLSDTENPSRTVQSTSPTSTMHFWAENTMRTRSDVTQTSRQVKRKNVSQHYSIPHV